MRRLMTAGHPYAALIYQLELRINMDYATYTVGITRRLSERGILELVERDPGSGSNWDKKQRDRHWVQRQFRLLVKFGLIEKIPKKRMCYRLLLANVDLFRSQEARTKSGAKARTKPVLSKNKEDRVGLRVVADNAAGNPAENTPGRAQENRPNTGEARTTSEKIFTTTTREDDSGGDDVQPGLSFEDLRAVDMAMVVGAYHDVLPGLPVVRFFDNTGYRHLVARIWFHPGPDGLPTEVHKTERFWRQYFTACGTSDFLMGRVFDQRRGKFKANFKYLLGDDVFLKVLNGEYS